MLKAYSVNKDKIELRNKNLSTEEIIWIDLVNPTTQEKEETEKLFRITLPGQEEIQEIELSSRIYREKGIDFLTTPIITNSEGLKPESHPVCFILLPGKLLTLRFAEPSSFAIYSERIINGKENPSSRNEFLVGILETIADRTADIIEKTSTELESISYNIFNSRNGMQNILRQLGHKGDILSKTQETLAGLSRILSYLEKIEGKEGILAVHHDVNSISEYATALSNKITFLLDAALGMVNIEQNRILKIFALFTLVMMPPTIIVGFFGMNFHYMIIDMDWNGGPIFAIITMFLSALIPLLYLRKKGWF